MSAESNSSGKTILLGVTGSIAAFKAADIASHLVKLGHQVHVIMTDESQEFITPLTLQTLSRQAVITRLADEADSWQPGHIQLADRADLLLIAPATANMIAKLAHGLADDALSSIALAVRAPVLIAPAMNGNMWQHVATESNVKTLTERGVHFIGPEQDGMLACGYEGVGRLWNVEGIIAKTEELLS